MFKTEPVLLYCAILTCLLLTGSVRGNMSSCIRNCGQCKSMYGRFFQGTACADSCLAGSEGINCFNPSMVSRFLKRRSSSAVLAPEVPLGGKYEYYSVDDQPAAAPLSGGPALFKMFSARATQSRK